MTQLTVFLTIVIVASSCLIMGYSQAASTGGGSGQSSAKKLRVLSPAASRVYRLLHYGVSVLMQLVSPVFRYCSSTPNFPFHRLLPGMTTTCFWKTRTTCRSVSMMITVTCGSGSDSPAERGTLMTTAI